MSDEAVRPTANLAQLLTPVLAEVAMHLAKARGEGRFELAWNGSELDTFGTIPET